MGGSWAQPPPSPGRCSRPPWTRCSTAGRTASSATTRPCCSWRGCSRSSRTRRTWRTSPSVSAPWAPGCGGGRGQPSPLTVVPAPPPPSRQAVHRAETLGPADRHLCLTSWRRGPRRPRGLDLRCPSMGWGAACWPGSKGQARGHDTARWCWGKDRQASSRVSASWAPRPWTSRRRRAPHRTSAWASPLAWLTGRTPCPAGNQNFSPGCLDGRWGHVGIPRPRPDPRAVSLRASRGPETVMPAQAKAARPARRIHPGKGVSSWLPPLPSPRAPPSFVNHPALYAGGLDPGLPLGPGCCTTRRAYTPVITYPCADSSASACVVPAARVALGATQPSYLNVLLGTDSTKHRASKTQHRRCCRLSHFTPKMCLIFCSSFSFFFFFLKRKLIRVDVLF